MEAVADNGDSRGVLLIVPKPELLSLLSFINVCPVKDGLPMVPWLLAVLLLGEVFHE